MDLLVELCLQNHLNPSHHALEARSAETQQALSFKPNTLLGTLNIHTVHLKEKVAEEKVTAVPPKVPEVSGCAGPAGAWRGTGTLRAKAHCVAETCSPGWMELGPGLDFAKESEFAER